MSNEPFNDDPDYLPVKRFRPMLILAFLNFHRRFILGALLLGGVAYLLVRLNEPSQVDDSDTSTAQITDHISQPAIDEPTPQLTETIASVVSEKIEQTANQQINWLLSSADTWKSQLATDAIVMLQIRLTQIKDIMKNHDLKPSQRTYCVQESIKVIGYLSELDQKTDVGAEGIDKKVAEVKQLYETSDDNEIAALAKAIFVSHLLRQFSETQNDENLEAFRVAYSERKDAIANSDSANLYITYALRDATAKASNVPSLREIAADHLSSVLYVADNSVVDLAKNLYFPEVDWMSLASRIKTRSPGANTDLQLLLTGLKKSPDTPLTVYTTLGSAIKWFHLNDEHEKAMELFEQLEEIGPTITSKRIHDEVQKGIRMLKVELSE